MTTILNSNILEFGFLLGFWVFQLGFWVLKNPKTHLKNPKTQVGWVFRKTHMGGSTLPRRAKRKVGDDERSGR